MDVQVNQMLDALEKILGKAKVSLAQNCFENWNLQVEIVFRWC